MSSQASRPKGTRSHRSLFSILFGSQLVLASFILSSMAIFFYVSARHAMLKNAESDLLGAAQLMTNQLRNGKDPDGLAIPDSYFHRFGKAPRDQAFFAVWDATGEPEQTGGIVPKHAVFSSESPPTSGRHPFKTYQTGNELSVIVGTPTGGQLWIGRPLAKETDGLRVLVYELLSFSVLVFLVVGIISSWISRLISKPINELSKLAQSITIKNLDDRLPGAHWSSEMVNLSAAFNRMLETLSHSFTRQRQFTADAAHELRTPVAIILSQSEYCLSRERNIEAYRDGFITCQTTALHMKKLVEDLLDLSRFDSAQTLPVRVQLDLCELTHQVVKLLQPLASQKNLRLSTDLQPSLMLGDESQMRQVLMNLISNALEYNSDNGFANVSVIDDLDQIKLVVEDGGIGIAESNLPNVFNRFYRVDPSRTTSSTSGTGLGLSLVEEIVHAHGGKIEIKSVLSQGTRVFVSFPRIPE